jgi:hypothetical protein
MKTTKPGNFPLSFKKISPRYVKFMSIAREQKHSDPLLAAMVAFAELGWSLVRERQ